MRRVVLDAGPLGLVERRGRFLVRQHKATLRWEQGLRIKIGRLGKVEKPALESDFDQ